ncbi:hypothetical protein B0T26DRAFT_638862 [Lasiosphaeria miniovina]|uniref:HNH nuclease domain-containing protein n=1 Tax=Lasiosphaeria miniovina TaxID=1954250 RepID=A0AA40E3W2_9PEZI|nr:uncharacterized protein B0T26DRAFT_638862 [Lasiosphaeria miniovina]KAK0727099.1 hypothetical protein B0T26DRAFT_638862 [Lasiosphaeria miniovina]
MDSIFGTGARDELFSPFNGISLHPAIEQAFDRGFLVIVPNTNLEAKDSAAPWKDKDERHQALKDWETTTPREYRIMVLDATSSTMQQAVFSKEVYNLEFNNLAGLHGRRLQFLNESRPRTRYVWWTFLNATTQLTWKGSLKSSKSLIQNEVLKGTRYWGTHGRYVKKNILLGFVNEIGHDVSSIAKSTMEHAIEEEEEGGPADQGPDQLGLAVVADRVVRRAQEHDGFDYEFELEDESEEDD